MTTTLTHPRARATVAVLAWIGATLFGLAVAAETRIGPILVSLSYNHGIHAGDILAFAAAYATAALVTAFLYLR